MKKYNILNRLNKNFLVAVVRGDSVSQTTLFIDEMIEGGIKNIEVTYTVPNASNLIEEISNKYGENIVLGAGTVMDSTTARLAIEKGAKYIVSPHFDKNISKLCNIYSIPYLPGCSSSTEIIEALKYGSDLIKLFPGGHLGAKFIKDIKGPIPNVELMPSGGVNLDNMYDWIKNGCFAIGIGSDLTKDFTGANYESIRKKAEAYVNAYKSFEGE
ncbi:bifunctional 2-keto-4-hydroxyglutarate aldolase/2-keto-3-deoxy-6-phosphogluconate aldolase [Staphylococcus succinus]|uniref:bifunctional 2-keto-4-hydroxyglutarate aldolase/2-keto-3-deoxy-6-phosphogluconate aldolase n=1 Tax=Staphylococcus succinus TaxID=61015 RepID=UPI000E688B20|nr:bifunctional 2-keto-4-hydroxyglutarate aldolase/2-keto-3-deoxy-6-phosphogluconate aldolase [Staphylococcus succinus]RIN26682.1 bifunctional 4-hydroxy-2-oxoglutarate aldolase/2-dehydro-3-deoxy-phosphogluconate aldolase [Staphylococcus succinus]